MAISIEAIRSALSAPSLEGQEFALLAGIAALKATEDNNREVQDLVIRALDRSEDFENEMSLLMSLARGQGLFPYVDSIAPDILPLADQIALEMNRPENLDGVVFHRVQSEVYRKLMAGENVILSAPTSFGKTVILDALIASGKYNNLVIIVPTIALIDELRRRLARFTDFRLITHPGQSYGERNLFVLTQERYLAIEEMPVPDFFFVDEFYKLDDHNGREKLVNDRSELLNRAMYRLRKTGAQFYLAAPMIQSLSELLPAELRASLIVTNFSTVAADTIPVTAETEEDERREIRRILSEVDGPTLIFCRSPNRVRMVAKWLQEDAPSSGYGEGMPNTAKWLEDNISSRWSLPRNLRSGIGVHHGRLPRWLGPLIIKAFDAEDIGVLVCTNSLIEGVNTRAKNIIILDKTIGNAGYNYFTFANIRGRGGRMLKHFIGRIFLFNPPPVEMLPSIDIPGLSQSDGASDSLLLSIDEEDRSERTRERLREVIEQPILSVETMRKNAGVSPADQIELAKHLSTVSPRHLSETLWTKPYPTYKEILAVVSLVWEHIPPRGRTNHLATTAKQLSYLVKNLSDVDGDVRAFISTVTERAEGEDAYDSKVEDAYNFLRFWIDHNLPARLRALDSIAKEILPVRGIKPGNYEAFAARMEAGFQAPLLLTAEEFGIPSQVTKKLLRRIPRADSLDALIWGLRNLDLATVPELTQYERDLLDYALSSD